MVKKKKKKTMPANTGDVSLIPGGEDPLEEEMAAHSRFSCLENPMDRGLWWATVHRVAKSWTQLK